MSIGILRQANETVRACQAHALPIRPDFAARPSDNDCCVQGLETRDRLDVRSGTGRRARFGEAGTSARPISRKTLAAVLLATIMAAAPNSLAAQAPSAPSSMQIAAGITQAVSEHVHVIPANGRSGVPNVGIVTGSRAVLVIESGLGSASGKTVVDETRRIAGERRIYVIATHSHLEHVGGEQAFPKSATILRPTAQQVEIDAKGAKAIETFRAVSLEATRLLAGFAYRPADILLGGSAVLDLGGVTVEIITAAPAHTDGDIALFVRQDGVLFTGDVVQQNYVPILSGTHSSLASWLEQIDKLERVPAQIIVPSHTAITDRRAFADMREMIVFVRDRWAAIKARGLAGNAANDELLVEFKVKYPNCPNTDLLRVTESRL